MKWTWRTSAFTAAALLLAGALIWTQTRSTSAPRNDFTNPVFFGQATTTLLQGNGWIAEYYRQEDCLRFRIGDMASNCTSASYQTGDFATGMTEGHGLRIVWVITAYTEPTTVRWWSNASARVEYTSVALADNAQVVAIQLAPGEKPWGLQVLDPDGVVIGIQPYLG